MTAEFVADPGGALQVDPPAFGPRPIQNVVEAQRLAGHLRTANQSAPFSTTVRANSRRG